MNSAWMKARELPLLYSIHHTWNYLMEKFYSRRHCNQKHDKYTNYCIEYYQRELTDSFQYLIAPHERDSQIALAYRTSAAEDTTRRVELKARKCSCLAFQDHKIPCRHAIATARFFGVDPLLLIADFYQISAYREQYRYSLKPVLISELEPDGYTQPPLIADAAVGRKVVKRFRRITRETEARRLGRMFPPDTQSQQEEEAQARYLSGASYLQRPRDSTPYLSTARSDLEL